MNQALTKLITTAVLAGGGSLAYVATTSLPEAQRNCNKLQAIHDLLLTAENPSMEFTDGEARRTPEQAKLNAAKGIGISQSLHIIGLARDKHLWVNGKYSANPKDYLIAGLLWEKLGKQYGIPTAWGGRWKSVDAVHFSCKWGAFE
jgi:D-alanyl-D-alanine carboxypeptidase